LFLSSALLALQTGRDELSGVLFVFAAVQLQVLVLGLILIVVWAFAQHRWRFLGWCLGSWVALSVLGYFFLPGWMLQNIRAIAPDFQYQFSGTLRSLLAAWFPGVGQQISQGTAVLLMALLGVEWWQARTKPLTWLVWTLSLTLTVAIWLSDRAFPHNVAVSLGTIILIGAYMEKRWLRGGRILVLILVTGISAGLWGSFWLSPEQNESLFFFVIPLIAMLGLYWVRWWVARSVRLNL